MSELIDEMIYRLEQALPILDAAGADTGVNIMILPPPDYVADQIRATLAKLEPDTEDAYGYASRLFRLLAPQCEPLPTTLGVLTQIDNWIAGWRDEIMCPLCKRGKRKAYELLGRWLLDPGNPHPSTVQATLELLAPHNPLNHQCPEQEQ